MRALQSSSSGRRLRTPRTSSTPLWRRTWRRIHTSHHHGRHEVSATQLSLVSGYIEDTHSGGVSTDQPRPYNCPLLNTPQARPPEAPQAGGRPPSQVGPSSSTMPLQAVARRAAARQAVTPLQRAAVRGSAVRGAAVRAWAAVTWAAVAWAAVARAAAAWAVVRELRAAAQRWSVGQCSRA